MTKAEAAITRTGRRLSCGNAHEEVRLTFLLIAALNRQLAI